MTNETLATIDEVLRIPAPCPQPQSLACDGTDLWIGSGETYRIYGLRGATGEVFEEAASPGQPIGMVVTGDALRVVMSDEANSRFIRRYVFGHGYKTEAIPCPEDTGSFLAYDGDNLFLSQRYLKQILELDATGAVRRTIAIPREITGMVVVNGCFYLMTVESKTATESRVLRVDARKDTTEITELVNVPFVARSLGYDGAKFWTNCRSEATIVAFNGISV